MGSKGGKMASWPIEEGDQFATFAAGCFWSVELMYQRTPGVKHTAVGYIGGSTVNPTYEQVCSGSTGHAEAVQLVYNEKEVSYKELVELFFKKHDPTTLNRQGGDCGTQYRSAVFYHSEEQKLIAEQAKAQIPKAVTEIVPAGKFWPAEEYHQQYLAKGGRHGSAQSAAKGCKDPIRCYG